MTHMLVAVYQTPKDTSAFDAHYANVHTPLVEKIPGLLELRVSKIHNTLMGSADIYLIAQMVFADREALDAAMTSDENKAAGRDLGTFARGLVTLCVAEG